MARFDALCPDLVRRAGESSSRALSVCGSTREEGVGVEGTVLGVGVGGDLDVGVVAATVGR